MRAPKLSLLPTVLAILALVAPYPAQAAPDDDGDRGVFSTKCEFSHANNDDPIVYPGEEDGAHRHHFMGSTAVDYATTTASLKNGETNCDRPKDKSAYWVPALYRDGVELPFEATHVYYRNGNVTHKELMVPFPRGLRMVAGTTAFPEPPPGFRTAEWACQGSEDVVYDDIPATCASQKIIATITFPSCWDGERKTSSDQSHMAYPWQNPDRPRTCPSTHPVVLPEVTEWYRWDLQTTDMRGITLASGDGDTLHADFWNAWNKKALARLVTNCLLGGLTCGTVSDGTR